MQKDCLKDQSKWENKPVRGILGLTHRKMEYFCQLELKQNFLSTGSHLHIFRENSNFEFYPTVDF